MIGKMTQHIGHAVVSICSEFSCKSHSQWFSTRNKWCETSLQFCFSFCSFTSLIFSVTCEDCQLSGHIKHSAS